MLQNRTKENLNCRPRAGTGDSVNFVKFLRTSSFIEHLRWLLLLVVVSYAALFISLVTNNEWNKLPTI